MSIFEPPRIRIKKSKREVAFFDKVAFCVARNRASRAT